MPKSKRDTDLSSRRQIPGVGEGKRGTKGHIAYLLRQANSAVRNATQQAIAPTGLTHPQFITLTLVNTYDALSGAEIARLALLAPQTVTVITRNLVRDGLLLRSSDSRHAGIVLFAATEHGRAILKKATSMASSVENTFTEILSERDEAVVRKWLVEIASRA
jgi:DNA-binding MarR family transcriptional regulator